MSIRVLYYMYVYKYIYKKPPTGGKNFSRVRFELYRGSHGYRATSVTLDRQRKNCISFIHVKFVTTVPASVSNRTTLVR